MTLKTPGEELEFEIAKLDMQPGDVLVARILRPAPAEAAARLRAFLQRELPGIKTLVIDASIELSVVGKSDGKRLAAKHAAA